MILIIGLGNPGKKYERTRHNIGSRVIDELEALEFASLPAGRKNVILAKPQTFMNESGKAVKKIATSYKLPANNLIIIHDDIDLPLGKIKIVKNRGAAGHKGVESIIKELKTKDFIRFRIGIKPKETKNKRQEAERFVLQKFSKNEEKVLKEVIKKTAEAVEMTINEGLEKAMNEYNN